MMSEDSNQMTEKKLHEQKESILDKNQIIE
jgi:hypothetical protein